MRIGILGSVGAILALSASTAYGSCLASIADAALAKWNSHTPSRYAFTITEHEDMRFSLVDGVPVPTSARVEVRNGKVTSIRYAQDEGHGFKAGSRVPRKVWRYLTAAPSAMFEQVRKNIAWAAGDTGHIIDCQFDESTGMLVRLFTDSKTLSDSFYQLEVRDFGVVP